MNSLAPFSAEVMSPECAAPVSASRVQEIWEPTGESSSGSSAGISP